MFSLKFIVNVLPVTVCNKDVFSVIKLTLQLNSFSLPMVRFSKFEENRKKICFSLKFWSETHAYMGIWSLKA